MAEFARGARIRPKETDDSLVGRLAESISYPRFVVYIAQTAIVEYGQRDKEQFLKHLGVAFDRMLELSPGIFACYNEGEMHCYEPAEDSAGDSNPEPTT